VVAVALTAAIVHFPWSLTSRTNIAELDNRLNSVVIRSIAEKVDGLLDNAVAARQAIATNLINRGIDIADDAQREFLFLSFLQSQPGLTSIAFAWPDDHLYLVFRALDGTIRIEETIPGAPTFERVTDIYRVGAGGSLVFEERRRRPTDYRVTQELWYLTAFDKDAPAWSNIYGMRGTGTLGVTTPMTVMRNGELLGVLGVSITLNRLSAFLDSIDVSPHGALFLTNVYDELVATQKQMNEPAELSGSVRGIKKLEESTTPAARVTVAALKANGVDLDKFAATRHFDFRDPASGVLYFVTLAPLDAMGLIVSVVIPEADFLGAINRNMRFLVLALSGFIVALVVVAAFAARRTIGQPLARVTANLKELEDFRLDKVMPIPSRFSEIRQVSAATARMSASLASFKKYIPTELVRTLFARGIEAELGGERRELTILFMDLAGFTRIAERLGDEVIGFLGGYLSEMSNEIQDHRGTIDKYIGDAIMAFWGAPVPDERHALDACRAALACQARLDAGRRATLGRTTPELRARIGINTGTVLVGNVGSRDRLNYTVIGDPVNVASRLESVNKVYGTEIIIGENTYALVRELVVVRPLDRVAVYGKEKGLEMYELLALKDGRTDDMMAWISVYEEGRAALRARDWDSAVTLFRKVIDLRGGRDSVSSLQIARAEAFKTSPPPADWDGLIVMEAK
jgi:adenylate cyclase